jgi:hypothetical protein
MAPRKKYLLVKAIRIWNDKHPNEKIEYAIIDNSKFQPETLVIGPPARETLKRWQRATKQDVTGQFNRKTMRALLEVVNPSAGIRNDVMATAHDEEGTHEWPPGSNRGPVMKYLESIGIKFGAPWCAAFVSWCLKENGFKTIAPQPAWCPSWYEFAAKKGLLKPMRDSKSGDLWLWNWNGGPVDHIGFCDEGLKGSMAYYVDGNVGANGGTVTDSARPSSGIAYVIDLQKLYKLS